MVTNGVTSVMGEGGISAVDVDLELLSQMEVVLWTVQNVAEYADPASVLEGGDALEPEEVLALRGVLTRAGASGPGSNEAVGRLGAEDARRVAGYLALFQANPHNASVYGAALGKHFQHMTGRPRPVASGTSLGDIPFWRFRRRRQAAVASAQYERAKSQWNSDQARAETAKIRQQLGFETAACILNLLASND